MLKVTLIAIFVAGSTCREYNENSDRMYLQMKSKHVYPFAQFPILSNREPQNFNVTFEYKEIIFVAADQSKALSFGDMHGELVLSKFIFSFHKSGIRYTIRFKYIPNTYNDELKVIIGSDVYSTPLTEELREHARTHALNLELLTEEDVAKLREPTDQQTTSIQLSVQWIIDVLTNAKQPAYNPNRSDDIVVYMSPPTVLNADLIKELSLLSRRKEKSTSNQGMSGA